MVGQTVPGNRYLDKLIAFLSSTGIMNGLGNKKIGPEFYIEDLGRLGARLLTAPSVSSCSAGTGA